MTFVSSHHCKCPTAAIMGAPPPSRGCRGRNLNGASATSIPQKHSNEPGTAFKTSDVLMAARASPSKAILGARHLTPASTVGTDSGVDGVSEGPLSLQRIYSAVDIPRRPFLPAFRWPRVVKRLIRCITHRRQNDIVGVDQRPIRINKTPSIRSTSWPFSDITPSTVPTIKRGAQASSPLSSRL